MCYMICVAFLLIHEDVLQASGIFLRAVVYVCICMRVCACVCACVCVLLLFMLKVSMNNSSRRCVVLWLCWAHQYWLVVLCPPDRCYGRCSHASWGCLSLLIAWFAIALIRLAHWLTCFGWLVWVEQASSYCFHCLCLYICAICVGCLSWSAGSLGSCLKLWSFCVSV